MTQRLLLLRHGEVQSHRGDVPVTEAGLQLAARVGRRLATEATRPIRVISGETRRTRETAAALARGARDAGADVREHGVAFALRNPDLYLAGVRVDMVSSATAFAEQIPDFTESDVSGVEFFREWLSSTDRVGWWVAHLTPPGDSAATVAERIRQFAQSLADLREDDCLTVAITHSPVLRACTLATVGLDPGEPAWLAGLVTAVSSDRQLTTDILSVAP